jgi:hypothetical protein
VTDWIGEWFSVIEEDGENVDLLVGKLATADASIDWYRMSHKTFDGLGALMELLDRMGVPMPEIPRYRGKKPSALAKLLAFNRYRKMRPEIVPEMAGPIDAGKSAGVAWAIVPAELTTRLRQRAREVGANSNSYMLHALHRATCEAKLTRNKVPAWLIPVNLRGVVSVDDPKGNHSSFISLPIPIDASPVDVQSILRSELAQGAHFGAWVAMTIGTFIGRRRYRERVRQIQRLPISWTGAFSNLGSWSSEMLGMPAGAIGQWIGCPPASRKMPVAAACVIVDGALGIGLQVHPSMDPNRDAARTLVDGFLRHALAGIDQSSSRPTVGFTPWEDLERAAVHVTRPRGGVESAPARSA